MPDSLVIELLDFPVGAYRLSVSVSADSADALDLPVLVERLRILVPETPDALTQQAADLIERSLRRDRVVTRLVIRAETRQSGDGRRAATLDRRFPMFPAWGESRLGRTREVGLS